MNTIARDAGNTTFGILLLPLKEAVPKDMMDWASQSPLHSEPPEQTVALSDLDLSRWKPIENHGALMTTDSLREDLTTRLDDSGMVSPIVFSSDDESSSATSSEDEDGSLEPETPLEYARLHGLSRDYQMDHPLRSDLIPFHTDDLDRPAGVSGDAWDPDALLAEVKDSLNERLDVDREVAKLLMGVLRTCRQDEVEQIKVDVAGLRPERLKLELPVLKVDHELEMIAMHRRHKVPLTFKGIEPFQLDEERGEGLKFSSADLDGKQRLDNELQNEKLDVGKETVELFRQMREFTSGGQVDYASEVYSSYKAGKAVRTSPLLLPVTPPYSPSAPAPEAMQIDLTSSPDDLIAQDPAALEEELMDLDQASVPISTGKAPPDAQEIIAQVVPFTAAPSSSSPLAQKRLRNLRIESPLNPRDHTGFTSEGEPSAKKAKKVPSDSHLVSLLPDVQTKGSEDLSEVDKQRFNDLRDTMARAAESIQMELQNKQLIEIDTTMRVKVLNLDAVQIPIPWDPHPSAGIDKTQLHSRQSMLHAISKELLQDVRKWSGLARVERSLQWAPFASYLAKVDLVEQLDDGSLERYLKDVDLNDGADDVDLRAMIARNDESSLFPNHDSDDDEIEPVIVEGDDINEHIVEEEDGAAEVDFIDPMQEEHQPVREVPAGVPSVFKPDILDVLRAKQRELARSADEQLHGPEIEAEIASGLNLGANADMIQGDGIAQFMQLRGEATCTHRSASSIINAAGNIAAQSAQNQATAAVMVPQTEDSCGQSRTPATIPVPGLQHDQHETTHIIASSATMASRQLIRRIQTLLPQIDFCERDATIATKPQHREADFTISPSTGVIFTSLQKLKQKPLPGQPSISTIRDTIVSTATHYERLIILVSEGDKIPTEEGTAVRLLDDLDCEALTDLATWSLSLDSDIQVHYLPGGEAELASWLAAIFSHLGSSVNRGTRLLQEETMWERWLRIAGLNAYAAQAVLVQLKIPDGAGGIAVMAQERFGLPAFVEMSAQERVERFAEVLGGAMVLGRVSEGIDGGWNAKGG